MDKDRVKGGIVAAIVAFVAVVAVVLVAFFASGDEADLSCRSVDFDAQLQSNGDIRFTEHLDYQLKERKDDDGDAKPWKQLYVTFKLRNQDLTNITDIAVTNASTGEEYTQIDPKLPNGISDSEWNTEYAGHWYIADTTYGSNYPQPFHSDTDGLNPNGSGDERNIEIGWNISATVKQSSLRFDVSMTFHDMATQHDDVTGLQWEMFPEDNPVPVGKVTATVRFPKGVGSDDSWAWLHTEATSQTSRDADGTLHFTVDDLRTEQYVDLVAAFGNDGADGVERVESGDYLDELKSTEAGKEKQWRDSQRNKARLTVAGWLVCLVLGVLCSVLAIRGTLSSNREATYRGGIEYWRERPQVSPASAAHLIDVVDDAKGERSVACLDGDSAGAGGQEGAHRVSGAVQPVSGHRSEPGERGGYGAHDLLRPKPCQRRIDHHHAGDSAGCVVSQGDLGAEPFRGRLPAAADPHLRAGGLPGVRLQPDGDRLLRLGERLSGDGAFHQCVRHRIPEAERGQEHQRTVAVDGHPFHSRRPGRSAAQRHRQHCGGVVSRRPVRLHRRVLLGHRAQGGDHRIRADLCGRVPGAQALYGGFLQLLRSRCA
ncbi:membrane protein [Bifidobacterium ruminantium]|uniref:Membrane protein n=1 Tax=Bifidobacterium ruminantium TaxID=78346 RepID=A0A087CW70_BIFRU|nr:membrane protein [Bifidobacterium ruminantium]